jgi:UDP-N-acetylglucosamine--N-acetylmuramyl-(pentapeptide) pyrophosphoryl-undecaprenol N-acetylglucosamine transferase
MTNYLLAGGGTGGHVNPLLALAELIRVQEPESSVSVLGTVEGLEAKLVPERSFELLTVERLPFPRKPSKYALSFPFRFNAAVKKVERIILDSKIDVVVGFGGYASAPAYVAARRLAVPYVIHEANALPGMANRFGAKKAAAVAVAFPGTNLKHAVVTGMPLRSEIEEAIKFSDKKLARKFFNLDPDTTTLLVTGGSLGAQRINETIGSTVGALDAAGVQVLHITGERSELPELTTGSLKRIKYCNRMDLALASADLVVSRAGASTVSEISAFGLPAVYVPYPIGNGEQEFNVKHLVEIGAAKLTLDRDFTPDFVRDELISLVSNSKRLAAMKTAAKAQSINDGTQRLLDLVRSVVSR